MIWWLWGPWHPIHNIFIFIKPNSSLLFRFLFKWIVIIGDTRGTLYVGCWESDLLNVVSIFRSVFNVLFVSSLVFFNHAYIIDNPWDVFVSSISPLRCEICFVLCYSYSTAILFWKQSERNTANLSRNFKIVTSSQFYSYSPNGSHIASVGFTIRTVNDILGP